MNKETILNLKPGRDMDALIAEYVFKWGKDKIYHELKMVRPDLSYLPHYSTSISSAWTVIEKLVNQGDFINIIPTADSYNIEYDYGREIFNAETVPEAICKVALLTMLDKEDAK